MKVEIVKLDHFGRGITYINGKICFVEKALPGEIVKIKIVSETKKYLIGRVLDYYKISDARTEDRCMYADVCGGCDLEYLKLNDENSFKCEKVKEILCKFGGVSDTLVRDVTCANEYGYRNKVTLHGNNGDLGYYEKNSNSIISIDKCLLADEKINKVITVLNEMKFTSDIKEVVIRVSNDSSEVMVSLKGVVDDYFLLRNVVDVLIINDEVLLGEESIISSIGNRKYYVSDKSFFQVNKELTKALYDEVRAVVAKEKPEKVLDLYCGTGTIGIYISDLVSEVVGIDYSKEGIKDAKKNVGLNDVCNADFICEKVENVIENFNDIDMIIVDPPRAGLDTKTLDNIKRIGAKTVVYVSCDPVTLGRDLKILDTDYEVIEVKPYNMFPRTYHVECVSILHRKNVEK